MSYVSATGSNLQLTDNATLTISSATRTFMFFAYKPGTLGASGELGYVNESGGGTTLSMRIMLTAADALQIGVRLSSGGTADTLTGGTITSGWNWVGASMPAQSGLSLPYHGYLNGSRFASTNKTWGATPINLDSVRLGYGFFSAAPANGKYAYFFAGAAAGADDAAQLAAVDAIAASLATTEPSSIGTWGYKLLSDRNATWGGAATLSQNGTGSFDADMPTFGGGGGGTVRSRCSFMVC